MHLVGVSVGMTDPQMERRVYQQDDREMFERIETLLYNSEHVIDIDGVVYTITRENDDPAGVYYRLLPHGLEESS